MGANAIIDCGSVAVSPPWPSRGSELAAAAYGGAGQLLQRVGKLDDAVAIRTAHEYVDELDDPHILGLIELCVPNVVCVHDAKDELETSAPVVSAVVPVQVLGLLEHAKVTHAIAGPARRVAQR